MNKSIKNAQSGFTLIELIVVIVILGILAATALPKFANLGGDARAATVQSAKGALGATAAMVHAKYLLDPSSHADGSQMSIEGTNVAFSHGYPAADATLVAVAGLDGFTATPGTAPEKSITLVPTSIAKTDSAATCNVKYVEATATSAPVITTVATGCD